VSEFGYTKLHEEGTKLHEGLTPQSIKPLIKLLFLSVSRGFSHGKSVTSWFSSFLPHIRTIYEGKIIFPYGKSFFPKGFSLSPSGKFLFPYGIFFSLLGKRKLTLGRALSP
jgi:hypothetical protein